MKASLTTSSGLMNLSSLWMAMWIAITASCGQPISIFHCRSSFWLQRSNGLGWHLIKWNCRSCVFWWKWKCEFYELPAFPERTCLSFEWWWQVVYARWCSCTLSRECAESFRRNFRRTMDRTQRSYWVEPQITWPNTLWFFSMGFPLRRFTDDSLKQFLS